jgi:hypothetical protein
MRFFVDSSDTALTPFSQNSKTFRFFFRTRPCAAQRTLWFKQSAQRHEVVPKQAESLNPIREII